MTQSAKWSRS